MQRPQFDQTAQKILELLETSPKHLFITGNAGTGKSTLLEYWRDTTKKNNAVLAPTGVAALNVRGQTIHSFFGFRPDITVQKVQRFYRNKGKSGLFKKLDTIVIDEVSMVRADLLDCIDHFLKLHGPNPNEPFGGVRMVFIGDLHQLPPVVSKTEQEIFSSYYKSPYFFSALVFQELEFEYCELTKIHRQKDTDFIELLGAIRTNKLDKDGLTKLNTRHQPQFEAPYNQFYITLTTTNALAQRINSHHLSKLSGKIHSYQGKSEGGFDSKALPTAELLELKVGSQVMMVANDRQSRWVNGSLGKIIDIKPDSKGSADHIIVELENGVEVTVEQYTWEMFRMDYNPATDTLQTQTAGSYTQYPLTLAWAVTIHKSQGKTFDNVIIDFGWGTFAHGQSYVALSRCTSMEGIVLTKPFEQRLISVDPQVQDFLATFQYATNTTLDPKTELRAISQIIQQAIANQNIITFLDASEERRTLQPQTITETTHTLTGYCHTAQEVITLQLAEMREVRELQGVG